MAVLQLVGELQARLRGADHQTALLGRLAARELPRQGAAADGGEKQDPPEAEDLRLAQMTIDQKVLAQEDDQRVERGEVEKRRRLVQRRLVQHELVAVVEPRE